MTRQETLRWVERGLLGVGGALAVWCAATLVEARYFNHLPLPPADSGPVIVTQTLPAGAHALPGDARDPKAPQPATPSPAQGTLLGRLEAPGVQLSAPLLEGSDDGTLSHGAGHIEDTPFPGQPGNIGIAGHRDTVFRPLRRIHVGDALTLKTSDHTYQYRIDKTFIVGPDDVYVLDLTDKPTLTLVTCYPFEFIGHAPKRFIVQASLIGDDGLSGSDRAGAAGGAGKAGGSVK